LLVRIVEDALALLPIVGERLADRGATDAAVVHRPFELVHHLSLVGLLDKVHRPAIARVRLAYPLLEAAQILAVIVGELATSGRHDAAPRPVHLDATEAVLRSRQPLLGGEPLAQTLADLLLVDDDLELLVLGTEERPH